MKNDTSLISSPRNRRSFLKTGLAAAGAVGAGSLARGTKAYAQQPGLTAGDIAILQFLAAGEALEADFYTQYKRIGRNPGRRRGGRKRQSNLHRKTEENRSQYPPIHS